MVIRLEISKAAPGHYQAHCEGREGLTDHGSIAEALEFYGVDIPPDFACHVEVRYADVSIGTQSVQSLVTKSKGLAAQLTALAAEVWAGEEALQHNRTKSQAGACP